MAASTVAPEKSKTGATGTILQITGVVVDIQFPAEQLPAIYNAVETDLPDGTRCSRYSSTLVMTAFVPSPCPPPMASAEARK